MYNLRNVSVRGAALFQEGQMSYTGLRQAANEYNCEVSKPL